MIKLAIVGYGKMGKEIESVLDSNTFQLVGRYDIDNKVQDNLKEIPDVAIEFSTPLSVVSNVEFLASQKINIVCGTTGWYDKAEEVKGIIKRNNTGFIYASNFSIGVNIYFEMVKNAAEIFNKFSQYDIKVEETHHTQKLDKPSGTAIRIGEYLIEKIKRKDAIVNDKNDLSNHELNIISKRIENVVGNHKIIFNSEADTIVLDHNAKSRRGFAEGALMAAKFIYGRKGFYRFEDVFSEVVDAG